MTTQLDQQPPEYDLDDSDMPEVPYSREAEEAAIGAVLINPDCLWRINRIINPDDFYIHRLRWIWSAYMALDQAKRKIDLLTVTEELKRTDKLDEIGGPAYLTSLINQVPSSLNGETYARIISERATRRKILTAANEMARKAYDKNIDVEEYTNKLPLLMQGLSPKQGGDFESLQEIFGRVITDIELRSQNPDRNILNLGSPKLDKYLGGLEPGQVIYVSGAPKVGKSRVAFSWALNMSRTTPGAAVSLEMKKIPVGRRLLSSLSSVRVSDMRKGDLSSEEWDALYKMLQKQDRYMWITDKQYNTSQLYSELAIQRQEHNIGWVVVDYARLLTDTGKDTTEKSAIISTAFVRMCHDLDLVGIMLHSVNKGGMNGEHGIQYTSGSGSLIHDADFVFTITELSTGNDCEVPYATQEQKDSLRVLWIEAAREMEGKLSKVVLAPKAGTPYLGEYSGIGGI